MSDDNGFSVTISDEATQPYDVPPISFDDGNFHCQYAGCGVILNYGGRGRHPKFCDEHKPNRSSNSVPKTPTNLKQIEASLTEMYGWAGMGVSMFDGFSGMQITAEADKLAHSWIILAQTNRNVMKFLTKITTGGGAGAVIMAHMMVAGPILQHHDLLPAFFSRNKAQDQT